MNKDEAILGSIMLKGLLADLPQADRDDVEAAANTIREVVAQYSDAGRIALSMVMCEEASK